MRERSKTKQLVINMLAQTVSFVTNLLISFLLTPYIVKHIGSEAYGFVGLANNFVTYVTIITAALNSMASRFITIAIHQNDEKLANKYLSSVVFANIVISIPLTVIFAVVIVFLEKLVNISIDIIYDVKMLWAFLFINFILGLIFNVFSVATFARNRIDLSSLRTIESKIICVTLLILLFVLFKPSVWFYGFATFVSGLYIYFSNVYYTKKLLPLIKVKKSQFDFSLVKKLLSAGVWNSVSHLSGTLSNGLDLLITNLFVTSTAMGTVSVAKTVPFGILSAFGMLSSVFMPELTISYAKNDYEDIRRQLNMAMKILGFFASIPIAFLVVFGKEFYSLWVPGEDSSLLYLLSVICASELPIALPLEPLWNVFTVTNKVKQSSLFLLSNAVISTVIVLALMSITTSDSIKMCIIVGTSAIIGIIRNLVFLPTYGAKCLGFKKTSFYPIVLKNAISTAFLIIVSYLIKTVLLPTKWLSLFICLILVMTISCISNFFFILSSDEKMLLKSNILKTMNKS